MNWRDIRNPEAGGAEVFTDEVAKRLVQRGWSVTLFTSMFPGAQPEEDFDGVEIVRRGGRFTVYSRAKDYCRKFVDDFDLVVDEINTRPFMTPRFLRDKPIVALIHQLAREYWFQETAWPVSWLGYFVLEEFWLKHYRRVKTITVSRSTQQDLEQLGFQDVVIVPEGISVPVLDAIPLKDKVPTLLFVGRLKKSKKPHHAIRAYQLVREKLPDAKLWIVGDGYMRRELEQAASEGVDVKGRVDENTKVNLLTRAHVLLFPALREGWGLSITEANARGTPAVGYDVPGVRDAILDGKTGLLVNADDWTEMASAAYHLLENQELRDRMAANALHFASKFSWDRTTESLAEHCCAAIAQYN